jgi:hypothetical protein
MIQSNERLSLEILRALAWHADSRGLCYPSTRRLMRVTKRGHKTIIAALESLLRFNLIKIHRYSDPIRGVDQLTYQINPHALYVREIYEPEAIRLWAGSLNFSGVMAHCSLSENASVLGLGSNVHNQEPETEPKTEPKTKPKTDPQSAIKTGEAVFLANGQNTKNGKAEQNGKVQREAQAAQNPESDSTQQREAQTEVHPPGSAVPPAIDYTAPLLNPFDEDLAQYLNVFLPTRLNQARELVAVYGRDQVVAALEHITSDPTIRSRGGALTGFLRKYATAQKPNEKLSGQYADFFER